MILVQDFLDKNQHLAALHTRNWEDMMEAKTYIDAKFLDKNIANDLFGKIILGHCFDEPIALAFKRHINKFFVCEDDRKRGMIPEAEMELPIVFVEIEEEAA